MPPRWRWPATPAGADAAQAVAARLATCSHAELRDLAPAIAAFAHYARAEWEAAAAAFETVSPAPGKDSFARNSGTYLLGDCHLKTGRAAAALVAYGDGLRAAADAGAPMNIGFQGEGIVAALVDLGRHEEALEALGAADLFTSAGSHPRNYSPMWGETMRGRLAAARAALGDAAADAAYARGHARRRDEALAMLLALVGGSRATSA